MRALALIALGGCSLAAGTEVVPHAAGPRPTLVSSALMYNARIVTLRTTLGRAGIMLDTRGADQILETTGCSAPDKGSCVRCTLAGDERAIPGGALEAFAGAFDRYPTEVLAAAHIDRVELCRRIDYTGSPEPGGVSDLETHTMMMSVDFFLGPSYSQFGELSAEDIVHHEYFHLLESARDLDRDWPTEATGFVDPYAATAGIEDRASVYQYLMARPDQLCELAHSDAAIRRKAHLIWARVAAVTGDEFMRARSPCADWIAEAPPG